MAVSSFTASSLDNFKQKFDDQLTCSVCLDRYIKPKTLPCLHSFCLKCIQRIPVGKKGGQNCIRCPTCRIEYPLPEGGAADLPNAFQINSLLELREELVNRKSSSITTCSIHNDPFKVYCETCCKLICRDCAVSKEHKSHDFELECYRKHCQQIEAELKLVQQKVADTDTAMAGLTAREMEVTDQGEEIKKEIRTHAQQLIDQVVRSERQLMQEVDTTVQHKRQLLRKQKEEAERVHSQLKICEELIEHNLNKLSQERIIAEKQAMIDQMRITSENVDPVVFLPIEKANLHFIKSCNGIGIGNINSNSFGKAVLESPPFRTSFKATTATLSLLSLDGSPFLLPSSLITCKIFSPGYIRPVICDVRQTQKGKYTISFTPQSHDSILEGHLVVNTGGVEAIVSSSFTIFCMFLRPIKTIHLQYGHCHLAVCDNGDILATEQNTHTVTILDKEGKRVKSLGTKGIRRTKEGQFDFPIGVAVSKDGHVLVTDRHQMKKLTFDGVYVKAVGKLQGSDQLQLCYPCGIAVHPTSGHIFVTDEGNNCVQVFNANVTFSQTITLHDGDKHIDKPCARDVALDKEGGYIYVVYWGNHCIAKLTATGQYITRFGSKGSAPGQLQYPSSLAIHNNLVYVSEMGNHRVSVFNTQGIFLHCFGKKGSGDGDFNLPWGVAVDRLGNLYVSDYGNKRIVVYDSV